MATSPDDHAAKKRKIAAAMAAVQQAPTTFNAWVSRTPGLNLNKCEWNGIGRRTLRLAFQTEGAQKCDDFVVEANNRNEARARWPDKRYKDWNLDGAHHTLHTHSVYPPSTPLPNHHKPRTGYLHDLFVICGMEPPAYNAPKTERTKALAMLFPNGLDPKKAWTAIVKLKADPPV